MKDMCKTKLKLAAACLAGLLTVILAGIVPMAGIQGDCRVYAAEETMLEGFFDEIPLDEINEVVSEGDLSGERESFGEMVKKMLSQGESFSVMDWVKSLFEYGKSEVLWDKSLLTSFFIGILSCALFTSFTRVFSSKSLSETGFFVAYLVLFSVLSVMYNEAALLAGKVLKRLFEFMEALLPAFFLSMSINTGTAASALMYETALGLLAMADYAMTYVILPLIHFYFLLLMGACLSEEDRISKLVELLEHAVQWGIKLILGVIIGIQAVEAMVVPVAGGFKKSVFTKGAAMIPGVGGSIDSVSEAVFGAGKMIQNAIGTAGILFMVLICLIPIIKLLVISFSFQAAGALVEPISDKRVTQCINGVGKASGMLVSSVFTGLLSLFFTIAVLCAAVK